LKANVDTGAVASAAGVGIGVGWNFKCSSSRGATLILHEKAARFDALEKRRYIDLICQSAHQWLSFANNKDNGRNIDIVDLVLITGYDRTCSWDSAAFDEESRNSEISFTLSGPAGAGEVSFGLKGKWTSSKSVLKNEGKSSLPCDCSVPDPKESTSETSTNKVETPKDITSLTIKRPLSDNDHRNQAVFIRGYRVCSRLSLVYKWLKRVGDGQDGFCYYHAKKPKTRQKGKRATSPGSPSDTRPNIEDSIELEDIRAPSPGNRDDQPPGSGGSHPPGPGGSGDQSSGFDGGNYPPEFSGGGRSPGPQAGNSGSRSRSPMPGAGRSPEPGSTSRSRSPPVRTWSPPPARARSPPPTTTTGRTRSPPPSRTHSPPSQAQAVRSWSPPHARARSPRPGGKSRAPTPEQFSITYASSRSGQEWQELASLMASVLGKEYRNPAGLQVQEEERVMQMVDSSGRQIPYIEDRLEEYDRSYQVNHQGGQRLGKETPPETKSNNGLRRPESSKTQLPAEKIELKGVIRTEPSPWDVLMVYILDKSEKADLAVLHDEDFEILADTNVSSTQELEEYLGRDSPAVHVVNSVGMFEPTYREFQRNEPPDTSAPSTFDDDPTSRSATDESLQKRHMMKDEILQNLMRPEAVFDENGFRWIQNEEDELDKEIERLRCAYSILQVEVVHLQYRKQISRAPNWVKKYQYDKVLDHHALDGLRFELMMELQQRIKELSDKLDDLSVQLKDMKVSYRHFYSVFFIDISVLLTSLPMLEQKYRNEALADGANEEGVGSLLLSPEIIQAFDSTLRADLRRYNPKEGEETLFHVTGTV
ncbi:hypothetical protein M422DRAFT_275142, partial [Sphaerobolus stellatus SS14]